MLWCKTLWVKPFSGWSKARRESVRNHLWADCSATNNKTRLGFFVIFRRISSIQVFEMNIQSYFLFGWKSNIHKISVRQSCNPALCTLLQLWRKNGWGLPTGDLRVCAFDFPVNGFQIFFPIYQLSILEWHSGLHQNVTLTLMTKSTLGLRRPFMPNEGEWKIWKSPQM